MCPTPSDGATLAGRPVFLFGPSSGCVSRWSGCSRAVQRAAAFGAALLIYGDGQPVETAFIPTEHGTRQGS
ncbi:hypothetical protein ACIRP5_31235 [Streptomyces sp. NPDC101221]|uniref:hypothetical protein n=1 Tax=Streptomyces sp. NPDC101221 TaxID=3366132 RepID=UPI0038194A32